MMILPMRMVLLKRQEEEGEEVAMMHLVMEAMVHPVMVEVGQLLVIPVR